MRLSLFYCDVSFWISWHRLARRKEAAAILWTALILMFVVHVVERRVLDQTPCMQGKDECTACLLLTPEQRKQLATPTYKLQKEKKSSKSEVLIDPSQVSVVGPVDLNQSVASVASSPSNVSVEDSFKKELSDLKDEWSTRFARIEALLTLGSNTSSAPPISAVGNIAPVFSPVKVKVTHPPPSGVLSSSPFLPHTVFSSPPGQEQV